MKNLTYLTLADCRNQNSAKFDADFKKCFFDAAKSIPQEVLVNALWGKKNTTLQHKKAA